MENKILQPLWQALFWENAKISCTARKYSAIVVKTSLRNCEKCLHTLFDNDIKMAVRFDGRETLLRTFCTFSQKKRALDLELVLQYLSDRARGKGTITSKGFAKSIKMENQRGFFPNCTLQKFSLK